MKSHITDISFFIEWLKEKRNLADSSIYVYNMTIQKFLKTNPNIDNLEDYNNFLVKYTIKKRNDHYYSILRAFIEFKIDDINLRKKLQDNLILAPRRKDIKVVRRHLSEEMILNVINYMEKPKHKIISLIQTLTGARAGDVLRAKKGSFVMEKYKEQVVLRLNLIGKRGKRLIKQIFDTTAQELIMKFITENYFMEDYYFLQNGKLLTKRGIVHNEDRLVQMNYHWYWEDLKQALDIVGINTEDFATHDFRRCFSRKVWEKYGDLQILQNVLDHEDPRTTMRYLKQSGLKNIDIYREMQE